MGLGVGQSGDAHEPHSSTASSIPSGTRRTSTSSTSSSRRTYSLSINQYESGDVAESDEPFKATYSLLDSQSPFRPRAKRDKPRIDGPQTALVVGPARRGDLDRQVRPREGAVRLGSAGQAQREVVVLGARGAGVGGQAVGRDAHPAHRPGGHRRVPRRRSRSAHHHRPGLQRRQHAALRAARQQDPERHQEPQQQGRHGQQLQRDPLRGQEGQAKSCTSRPRRTCPRWSSTTRP